MKSKQAPNQKTTITTTSRDAHNALGALEALATNRGFPSTDVALSVGHTMRALRALREEYADAQQMLLNKFAKRDAAGKIMSAGPQQVELEDPPAYLDEMKKLHRTKHDVDIFPVPLSALGEGKERDKPCENCKQVTGLPAPEHLALLVELGILVGH